MPQSDKHSLQIVFTKDGSQTILNEELGSTYHSRHGAFTESQHVFIAEGLEKVIESGLTEITLLEMGFGTGLNALLTAIISAERSIRLNYHALELFPIPEAICRDYQLPDEQFAHRGLFDSLHNASWNEKVIVNPNFSITKHHISLLEFKPSVKFDLIFYDAFEPETQPELWTEEVFGKLFSWSKANAVLTTYCCKGYVRRNLLNAGFEVEKVPGPPGKREMIVAQKPFDL